MILRQVCEATGKEGEEKMGKRDEEIIGYVDCACGCGEKLKLRKRHYFPSHLKDFPKFIKGHGQAGNKRGWKGGTTICNGYCLVYSPAHPFANSQGGGYVRRARLVMENYLGRFLEPIEIVHHINRNRINDVIENLELMTNSEHLSLHHKGRIQKRDSLGRFTKGW